MKNTHFNLIITFSMFLIGVTIPLIIFFGIQNYHQSITITNQKALLKIKTTAVATLLEERVLVIEYRDLLEAYYDSVLRAYGYEGIKIETIKVNPNNYKLKFPILPVGP